MKFSSVLVLCGFTLGVVILLGSASADVSPEDNPLDLADCKKVMARIAKRTLKAFSNCTKELKNNLTEIAAEKDEFEKKLGCAVRCTLFRMELLNEEGKITTDRIQKFMDDMVPQDAHEFGHELSSHCNKEYGTKLDMSEEYCDSYSAYAACMQNTLADFADKTSCHPGVHG